MAVLAVPMEGQKVYTWLHSNRSLGCFRDLP